MLDGRSEGEGSIPTMGYMSHITPDNTSNNISDLPF